MFYKDLWTTALGEQGVMMGVLTKTHAREIAERNTLVRRGSVKRVFDRFTVIDFEKQRKMNDALRGAAERGKTRKARRLLRKGAEINAKNELGETALRLACKWDHTETAEVLIDEGADVDTMDVFGRTPLMYASAFHSTDTVRLLIKSRASVYLEDNKGETALRLAYISSSKRGANETARLLEEYCNEKRRMLQRWLYDGELETHDGEKTVGKDQPLSRTRRAVRNAILYGH